MSSITSILKDVAEKSTPKTPAVLKRFNNPRFADTCKTLIKERNRDSTHGNLNTLPGADPDAYCIARSKALQDVRHSKKTSWRYYVS